MLPYLSPQHPTCASLQPRNIAAQDIHENGLCDVIGIVARDDLINLGVAANVDAKAMCGNVSGALQGEGGAIPGNTVQCRVQGRRAQCRMGCEGG